MFCAGDSNKFINGILHNYFENAKNELNEPLKNKVVDWKIKKLSNLTSKLTEIKDEKIGGIKNYETKEKSLFSLKNSLKKFFLKYKNKISHLFKKLKVKNKVF